MDRRTCTKRSHGGVELFSYNVVMPELREHVANYQSSLRQYVMGDYDLQEKYKAQFLESIEGILEELTFDPVAVTPSTYKRMIAYVRRRIGMSKSLRRHFDLHWHNGFLEGALFERKMKNLATRLESLETQQHERFHRRSKQINDLKARIQRHEKDIAEAEQGIAAILADVQDGVNFMNRLRAGLKKSMAATKSEPEKRRLRRKLYEYSRQVQKIPAMLRSGHISSFSTGGYYSHGPMYDRYHNLAGLRARIARRKREIIEAAERMEELGQQGVCYPIAFTPPVKEPRIEHMESLRNYYYYYRRRYGT